MGFGFRTCETGWRTVIGDSVGGEMNETFVRLPKTSFGVDRHRFEFGAHQNKGRAVPAHYFTYDLSRCLRERDWQGLKAWLPGSGVCHNMFWDDLPVLLVWVGLGRFG